MDKKTEKNTLVLISRIRYLLNRQIISMLGEKGVEGIASSHAEILFLLHRNGELSMTRLSHRLGRDKSTLTVLVRKLESLGYVARRISEKDRRVHLLRLTPRAGEFHPLFEKIADLVNKKALKGFDPVEADRLRLFLTRVLDNLS